MSPSPSSLPPRHFTLDFVFDTFASHRRLGYRFVSRESSLLHFPGSWAVSPDQERRVHLGEPGQPVFLRLGLWGRDLVAGGAKLELALHFRAADDAPPGQVDSPFDPVHGHITRKLADGVTFTDRDLIATHRTISYWALHPGRFGLPIAPLELEATSAFGFYYFPELTAGRYEFRTELKITPARLEYHLDPEMEVGELDDSPPDPDPPPC